MMKVKPLPTPPDRVVTCDTGCPACQDTDETHRWVERYQTGGGWVVVYDSIDGGMDPDLGVEYGTAADLEEQP